MRHSNICWVQLLTGYNSIFVYQYTGDFLHVTLKRRAEISADIFAPPLRYFRLSCKNLTITRNNIICLRLLWRKRGKSIARMVRMIGIV